MFNVEKTFAIVSVLELKSHYPVFLSKSNLKLEWNPIIFFKLDFTVITIVVILLLDVCKDSTLIRF